jgi:Fur family zinc uptake transcriptional regulator/Fur family ferric uptake transcriptional regulator
MAEREVSEHQEALRARGLKATPQRLTVLALLERAERPVGIPELRAKTNGKMLDTVTLYRSLETLFDAELVRKVDLRHGHADYELVRGDHHHHIICVKCGDIENIAWCPDDRLKQEVLKSAKRFQTLRDHSLEFFGTCKKCSINR